MVYVVTEMAGRGAGFRYRLGIRKDDRAVPFSLDVGRSLDGRLLCEQLKYDRCATVGLPRAASARLRARSSSYGCPRLLVEWTEAGVGLSLSGPPDTVPEVLVGVARSLRPASPDEWAALVTGRGPHPDGLPRPGTSAARPPVAPVVLVPDPLSSFRWESFVAGVELRGRLDGDLSLGQGREPRGASRQSVPGVPVRGTAGVTFGSSLWWDERGSIYILSAASATVPPAELVRVAEGLRPATDTELAGLVEEAEAARDELRPPPSGPAPGC